MRYLYIILAMMLFSVSVSAQRNHVPNPGFEDTIGCPTGVAQVNSKCSYWYEYEFTPDYFNKCAILQVGIPSNVFGYQQSYGNAYGGFGNNEYLATPIQPLRQGISYEVSMSASIGNNYYTPNYSNNNLGVYFFDAGPSTSPPPYKARFLVPQIRYNSYGSSLDTINWTRLTKTFIADSAYDNIVIGTFLDTSGNMYSAGYIYVDSVVIQVYDSFYVINDSMLCAGDTVQVTYHIPGRFNTGNIFTAELSNKSGSFNNPITIGTKISDSSGVITCIIPDTISIGSGYRIRVSSSSPAFMHDTNSFDIKIADMDSITYVTSSNSPLCELNNIILNSTSTFSYTMYQWTGPNGFNSTSSNPHINGASPIHNGNYYVTAHFYGCEVKDTLSVIVKPLPVKPVAGSNTSICAGDTLRLTTSSLPNVGYNWAGPNSFSSTVQNPDIGSTTTAMSGDYIITVDSNGCANKDTAIVLVKPAPAPVTTSNNTPICAGDTLKIFSTTSSTGVTYTWNGPGSYSANTQNSSRANSASNMSGWYKMIVNLNGCITFDSTYATVHAIPASPSITYSSPLCVGETLNLQASNVSGATYSWTGPGNFTATVQNPNRNAMQFGDTGTYKVTATVNGCTSPEDSITVHINPIPFVVILANPADSICKGDPVAFTALPNNYGGVPNYQWKVNAQNVDTGTSFNTSTLNDGDVITCEMTEHTKCSAPYKDESNDITMTVLPWLAPSVTITANPTHPLDEYEYVTFTSVTTNAGNNPQFQWKRNGKDVVGANSYKWSANTLNDNDSISVEVISDYKCPQPTTAVSNYIRVKTTGINDVTGIGSVVLCPNPNNGKFVIDISGSASRSIDIEVLNTLGQVVYTDRATTSNGSVRKEADLRNAATGVYLLRLKSEDGSISTLRFRVE